MKQTVIAHNALFSTDTMLRIGVISSQNESFVYDRLVFDDGDFKNEKSEFKRVQDYESYESAFYDKLYNLLIKESKGENEVDFISNMQERTASFFGFEVYENATNLDELTQLILNTNQCKTFLSDLRQNWGDMSQEEVLDMYASSDNSLATNEDQLQRQLGEEYLRELTFWEVLESLNMYLDT